ncbi:class I SAM-dependent methyltransferase [Mycobacteroides abscessus]|uniref:class I SAM-dependent methyltransferase n=1 Tax=Mycobacteroides abscessus TaxID=36809 RepID=UPI0009A8DB0A|nr:class I SAM-dependent methyltransferase [Mycobacteroides abscessus]MDO2968260.1 class I SAM-dependent methyltransferase [Mycobacteroides abscessus subsp. bolletii]MDO3080484.1 class I SAM-dependent methyltransferase [Mycobacteroides abscessus subsp. bolletii]SLC11588.1 Probable O-methyltransferase Omt [Mycobacteroides abscessus subsp. bolletii]
MGIDVSGITPEEETAFLTLKARAVNDGWQRPILRDPGATAAVSKIDYDFHALGVITPAVCQSSLRAKLLDDRVRAFVTEHPNAVVVDMGAGLDDGYRRVQPPATVDWYSVDLPGMATLRDEVMPPGPGEHTVGVSITDPNWLSGIPSDRPAIVIADGFFAFLTKEQIIATLRAITDHFTTGQLAFNDYGRMVVGVWISKLFPQKMFKKVNQLRGFEGYDDPRTPERWNPRLRFVEEFNLVDAPEIELFPTWLRISSQLARYSTSMKRSARILRFEF